MHRISAKFKDAAFSSMDDMMSEVALRLQAKNVAVEVTRSLSNGIKDTFTKKKLACNRANLHAVVEDLLRAILTPSR